MKWSDMFFTLPSGIQNQKKIDVWKIILVHIKIILATADDNIKQG